MPAKLIMSWDTLVLYWLECNSSTIVCGPVVWGAMGEEHSSLPLVCWRWWAWLGRVQVKTAQAACWGGCWATRSCCRAGGRCLWLRPLCRGCGWGLGPCCCWAFPKAAVEMSVGHGVEVRPAPAGALLGLAPTGCMSGEGMMVSLRTCIAAAFALWGWQGELLGSACSLCSSSLPQGVQQVNHGLLGREQHKGLSDWDKHYKNGWSNILIFIYLFIYCILRKLEQPFRLCALTRKAVHLFNTFLHFWSCYHCKASAALPPLGSRAAACISSSGSACPYLVAACLETLWASLEKLHSFDSGRVSSTSDSQAKR